MKYPLNWNIFPLVASGKTPAVKDWQKVMYDRELIKKPKNKINYGLATGVISDDIHVIDFDMRKGFERKKKGFEIIYKEFKRELGDLADTYICETPNGYHLYYQLKGFELSNTARKNGGYTTNLKGFINSNKTRFPKYLEGLDERGTGGYVIIPPSSVDGKIYKWIKEDNLQKISKTDYETIISFFEIKDGYKIREGFVDILKGIINPNEIKTKELPEHVYWKEMYRECHSVCGLKPEDLYAGLAKFQPGFDLEKTKVQIANKKNIDYILNGKTMTKKKI